jgi:hypothetical protein
LLESIAAWSTSASAATIRDKISLIRSYSTNSQEIIWSFNLEYQDDLETYHVTQTMLSIIQILSELMIEPEWNEKAYCDTAILVASLAEAIHFSQQPHDKKEADKNSKNTSTNDPKTPSGGSSTNAPGKESHQQNSNNPRSFREQVRQDYERDQKFYADLQEQLMKDLNDLNNNFSGRPHSNTHRNSSSRPAPEAQNDNQSFEKKFEALQNSIREQKERLQKRKEDLRNPRAEEQRRFDEELQKDEAAYQQRRTAEEQTAQKAAEERKAIDLKLQRIQEVLQRCHEEKLRQEQAEQHRKDNEDKKQEMQNN